MATLNPVYALSKVASPSPATTSPSTTDGLAIDAADWLAGSSAAMRQLRDQIRRVAPYFRTALLTGEQGCGEQAAAHMLHQLSPRSREPFLELGPENAEVVLGAHDSCAALAVYGMLYIPQPEQLSRIAQRTLLRLIRELGARAPRIAVFAERGLRPLVGAGGFSPELANALGALRITLPPLSERREDIPDLLTQLLRCIAVRRGSVPPELAPDLLDAAMRSSWTGNFPQLLSTAEGLMQYASKPILRAEDLLGLPGALSSVPQSDGKGTPMISLDEVIQNHLRAVLFACNGNKLRTAEILGISRSTLYRMLDAHAPTRFSLAPKEFQMAG